MAATTGCGSRRHVRYEAGALALALTVSAAWPAEAAPVAKISTSLPARQAALASSSANNIVQGTPKASAAGPSGVATADSSPGTIEARATASSNPPARQPGAAGGEIQWLRVIVSAPTQVRLGATVKAAYTCGDMLCQGSTRADIYLQTDRGVVLTRANFGHNSRLMADGGGSDTLQTNHAIAKSHSPTRLVIRLAPLPVTLQPHQVYFVFYGLTTSDTVQPFSIGSAATAGTLTASLAFPVGTVVANATGFPLPWVH
jgi:hypothetical protein